jgi:hypothetical protein
MICEKSSELSDDRTDRRRLVGSEQPLEEIDLNISQSNNNSLKDDSNLCYINTEYGISFWESLHSYTPKELEHVDFTNFIFSPLQKDKTLFCKIVMKYDNSMERLYPRYYLYLNQNERILLSAKKVFSSTSICYMITYDDQSLNLKDRNSYVGKISSNFLGTEFNIFDNGKKYNETKIVSEMRMQYGAVNYVNIVLYLES